MRQTLHLEAFLGGRGGRGRGLWLEQSNQISDILILGVDFIHVYILRYTSKRPTVFKNKQKNPITNKTTNQPENNPEQPLISVHLMSLLTTG